ncbi:hypothetical protein DEO72_LG8g2047 [Vigna unguiculata]|uniref:Uncharacterized protein n=1 Tax=Vigna unguiculata TaxID=3917 RepID=A0A4D6MVU9_VIGUN|nr:hypothetical protein DEO72_LG8g2047 [Vigna unguiculata]
MGEKKKLFSFVFEEKKIYHFCSYFSSVLFHTQGKKKKRFSSILEEINKFVIRNAPSVIVGLLSMNSMLK